MAPSSAKIKLASLDITSSASIRSLAKSLEETHGTINILVNNAGMAFSGSDFNADIVKKTMACNYDGTKDVRYLISSPYTIALAHLQTCIRPDVCSVYSVAQ